MIVEDQVYVDGERGGQALGSGDSGSWRGPGAFGWIVLQEPDARELERVRRATDLDTEPLRQVMDDQNRPSMAVAGESVIVAYQYGRYRADLGAVEFSDVVLALGRDFVVVVSESSEAIDRLRASLDFAVDGGAISVFDASAELFIDSALDVIEGLDRAIRAVEPCWTAS